MNSKLLLGFFVLISIIIVAGCVGAGETKAFKGKDCGTDLDCYYNLAAFCKPVEVVYEGVVPGPYIIKGNVPVIQRVATFTNLIEMRKEVRGKGCQTYTKILDVKFAEDIKLAPENKLTSEMREYYSSLIGKEATCISLMINEPMYPTPSFLKSNCEGSLVGAYSSDYQLFQEHL